MAIHETAIVADVAELADDVEVGPYALIEGPAKIGAGCRIEAHAQLVGQVEIGANCLIGRGTIIGTDPQDLNFKPETTSGVRIGTGCTLREYVTIHRSAHEGGLTEVGPENFLMAGTHLAHDCRLGEGNIIANNCLLAGHVEVGSRVFLGGGSVFHQFIRLGDLCMAQGNSAISKDVPPYVIVYRLNRLAGLNTVGLRRVGIATPARAEIKRAYELVYRKGLNLSQALEEAGRRDWPPEAQVFFDFLRQKSKKGVCFPR